MFIGVDAPTVIGTLAILALKGIVITFILAMTYGAITDFIAWRKKKAKSSEIRG